MKQNKKPKQTLESAQYGLEINFKVLSIESSGTKINIFPEHIAHLHSILWRQIWPFRLEPFGSTVRCVLITNIIFIFVQLFRSDCPSFTSRKLYRRLSRDILMFFLHQSDRAYSKNETTVSNYCYGIKLRQPTWLSLRSPQGAVRWETQGTRLSFGVEIWYVLRSTRTTLETSNF